MKLTPSQLAAIEHRGSNLLVAASAGSGKTEVLARRCVALIADLAQPCAIDRLLVVTFTRAAAAELRVRIARMLREEGEKPLQAELRRHLRRQELLVDTADIGTIDAWCGRIVREHFAEAGVDVNFAVLSKQDATLLRREVRDELFDRIYGGGEPLADEARAWIERATAPGDEFLRRLVGQLNAFRDHLVNSDPWLERQRAACAADDAESVLAAALGEECRFQHEQLQRILAGRASDGVAQALTPYCEQLATWPGMLGTVGTLSRVVDEIKAFRIAKLGQRGDSEPPEAAEVRERWLGKRLQERWSPDGMAAILKHASATAALVGTLLRLEERYQQMLAEKKRQRARYEFGDVLRMALDLLGRPAEGRRRTPTAVARRLQERYEHILIDEYQDTSPVQVEILRLVTRDGRGRTNRFMVGDVKQSIYGFRQAEPRLFSELIDALAAEREEGRVQYLSDNFRSHAGLLAGLNQLFALLFDRALGGTRFGSEECLVAGRDELPNPTLEGQPRIAVRVIEQSEQRAHLADDDENGELVVERIEREAQLAADQIQAMLRDGVMIPDRRPDGSLALRPLRLQDIVILLRSARQNAGLVARVLRDNGIRCLASGRETLLEALEVRDVCNVLSLLVNRRQDVPLAAYLRSPLAGLTPAELLAIRTAAERGADFCDAIEHYLIARPDADLADKLTQAMGQLERWTVAAGEQELPALLQGILRDGGLTLFAHGLPGGEQRVALLQSLQGLANAFAARGQGGVGEFVEHLNALTEEAIDPGALAAGDEDVVRIMTIHGAKGLEFPVVFLLAAGARFNEQSQYRALQVDEDVGVGLKFNDYPARAGLISARHHVVRQRVARRELEEELRLLYVATTRARERVIIMGHAPPDTWNQYRTQYADKVGAPPLVSRLSVHNRLEWVLMATAAGRLHASEGGTPPVVQVTTHKPEDIHLSDGVSGAQAPPEVLPPIPPEDDAWVECGRRLLEARIDRTLAEMPAVVSVSALKELALRERTDDRPHVLDMPAPRLRGPAFAAELAAPDGRALGTACHRFLELADFSRLSSRAAVQEQIGDLMATGRLSVAQANLVPAADVAWLATTPAGALLREHSGAARREVPFVHTLPLGDTGENAIVRGVIDCLVDTPAGLVILDYKTDAVRDDADLAARVAGYSVQLKLYAWAASAIFARPVARTALVFLRGRRIVDVPAGLPPPTDLLRVESA